jgi:hypothetical protein
MPLKKQPFGLVPILKKITYPDPLKTPPLERGGIIPSSPPHMRKPLLKEKNKS